MSEILNTLGNIHKNWKGYEAWEQEQDNLEARKKEYRKQNPVSEQEKQEAQKYGKTIINAINIMDEYSENKAEDVEVATEVTKSIALQLGTLAGSAIAGLLIARKARKGKIDLEPLTDMSSVFFTIMTGSTLGLIAATVPATVFSTKAQVWTSKVARYQARENELQDPRNFVIYTPEQIAEAKENAEQMPDIEEKESKAKKLIPLLESVSTIRSVIKDKEDHREWHKKYLEEDKQIKASYKRGIPEAQKKKAFKDQQIIVNTVKKINISAEEYSENMETVTNTVGVFGGLGIGILAGNAANFALKHLKLDPKNFFVKNKKLSVALAAIIPSAAMLTYFASLQKDAARIGRFKAKQELMEDPSSFTYIDPDKLKSETQPANDNKKGFFSTVAGSLSILKDFYKDRKEYKNYKETTVKEEKKLREALKKVEISDEQLAEGKNLQEKTFNTFEKIDDMSQKYSENMEMATDLAKDIIPSLAILGVIGAVAAGWNYLAKKVKKLEALSPDELGNTLGKKASSLYDKFKEIKNNKIFKPIFDNKHVQKYFSKIKTEALDALEEASKSTIEKDKIFNKEGNMKNSNGLIGEFFKKILKKPAAGTTVVAAGASVLAGITGVIFLFESYLTSLQKKAGKIGIMKAMEELQDPRYFVDKYNTSKTVNSSQETKKTPRGFEILKKSKGQNSSNPGSGNSTSSDNSMISKYVQKLRQG